MDFQRKKTGCWCLFLGPSLPHGEKSSTPNLFEKTNWFFNKNSLIDQFLLEEPMDFQKNWMSFLLGPPSLSRTEKRKSTTFTTFMRCPTAPIVNGTIFFGVCVVLIILLFWCMCSFSSSSSSLGCVCVLLLLFFFLNCVCVLLLFFLLGVCERCNWETGPVRTTFLSRPCAQWPRGLSLRQRCTQQFSPPPCWQLVCNQFFCSGRQDGQRQERSKLVQPLRYEPEPQTIHITDNLQETRVPDHHADCCFVILDMLDIALSVMTASSVEERTCNIRGLGGGRTPASVGTEEGGLPHRWRTRYPCTGRNDTTRQEWRDCHRVSTRALLDIDGPSWEHE